MHRSERTRPRPSTSRSSPRTYTSLISTSTKEDFRDTLLINKSTGVPAYATITEGETTTLYAIDASMVLQKIASVSWGGKLVHTTVNNGMGQATMLNNILVKSLSQGGFNSIFASQEAHQAYSYGRFTCKWLEITPENMSPYLEMPRNDYVCYQDSPQASAGSSNPSTSPGSNKVPQALATLVFCFIPGKPKVKIDLHSRGLLREEVGEDAFTDLDHVVLSALLTVMSGGRKAQRPPAGWLNEAQLQERLLAQHRALQPNRSTDTLPLYQAPSSLEGGPPPYASRPSLASARSLTR